MIYPYKCSSCNFEWEEEQKLHDEKIFVCPKCKKETAERLIGRTSFVLKGNGWYNSGGY